MERKKIKETEAGNGPFKKNPTPRFQSTLFYSKDSLLKTFTQKSPSLIFTFSPSR